MNVDYITNFPPELLLITLEGLPSAHDLAVARCVSRYLKASVDKNEQVLSDCISLVHLRRISSDFQLLDCNDVDLPLAIRNYINFFGPVFEMANPDGPYGIDADIKVAAAFCFNRREAIRDCFADTRELVRSMY